MLFNTAQPQTTAPRRKLPADVSRRPTPSDWPFAPLTESQRAAQAAIEEAQRRGDLRGIPSIFGDLS